MRSPRELISADCRGRSGPGHATVKPERNRLRRASEIGGKQWERGVLEAKWRKVFLREGSDQLIAQVSIKYLELTFVLCIAVATIEPSVEREGRRGIGGKEQRKQLLSFI